MCPRSGSGKNSGGTRATIFSIAALSRAAICSAVAAITSGNSGAGMYLGQAPTFQSGPFQTLDIEKAWSMNATPNTLGSLSTFTCVWSDFRSSDLGGADVVRDVGRHAPSTVGERKCRRTGVGLRLREENIGFEDDPEERAAIQEFDGEGGAA